MSATMPTMRNGPRPIWFCPSGPMLRTLDTSGQALDVEISAIEQTTAESMFLQFVINSQFATLNGADKAAVAEFEQRTRRHEELAQKFKSDYPAYQQHKSDYDGKVAAFERDCAGDFDGRDQEATGKARQQWQAAKAAGCAVTYWRQSESGRWEKQG